MSLILVLSSFFYAIPYAIAYFPSIIFYLPFYFLDINIKRDGINLLVIISTIVFFISILLGFNSIPIFNIVKSYLISLVYPISFFLGKYINLKKFKHNNFVENYLIFSIIFLSLNLLDKAFYYEPSSVARAYFGAFLIFYFISIRLKLRGYLKKIIIGSCFFILIRVLDLGSLSFIALLLFSIITYILISFIKLILTIIKNRINKKSLKNILIFSFSLTLIFILIFNFNIIDTRRTRALLVLFEFLKNTNLNELMSISGGRFLSTYLGYESFFREPLNFSYLFADKPSVRIDSNFLDSLSSSGLGVSFLTTRRPSSLISWILFNMRIFGIPIIIHILYRIFNLFKICLNEKNNKYLIFYSFSLSYILLIGFTASQVSLCLPWIILGICDSTNEKINDISNS